MPVEIFLIQLRVIIATFQPYSRLQHLFIRMLSFHESNSSTEHFHLIQFRNFVLSHLIKLWNEEPLKRAGTGTLYSLEICYLSYICWWLLHLYLWLSSKFQTMYLTTYLISSCRVISISNLMQPNQNSYFPTTHPSDLSLFLGPPRPSKQHDHPPSGSSQKITCHL